ncbi:hypothetical protein M0802_012186 [Mischocyttarus mexicanus]|nr:hypothetical protein M0802_012186 [Mischocyttarus mexicanus]
MNLQLGNSKSGSRDLINSMFHFPTLPYPISPIVQSFRETSKLLTALSRSDESVFTVITVINGSEYGLLWYSWSLNQTHVLNMK